MDGKVVGFRIGCGIKAPAVNRYGQFFGEDLNKGFVVIAFGAA